MHPLKCEARMRCRLTVAFAGVPTCYRSHVRVCLAITLYVRSTYSYVWHQCIEASLMQPGEKGKRTPQQGGGQYGSRNPGPTAILIIFDPSISTNAYEYVHINTCIRNLMLYAHVPYLRMYVPAHVLVRRQCTSTKRFRVSKIGAAKGCFRHWQRIGAL